MNRFKIILAVIILVAAPAAFLSWKNKILIVVGHKDSTFGRAIFYDLNKLQPGDKTVIERSDGKTSTFAVESSEIYSQNNFPSEKVYGDISHAGLRLITCTGKFNRLIGRYSHNLVVYAELIE